MEYQIRTLQPNEFALLEEFLYEAIFLPEGVEPPARSVLHQPELQVYIKDFGKKDDHAFVAEVDGKVVGAVWTRIMNDYGHVDDQTPSFAISLYPPYRGLGIGTCLMKRMLSHLKQKGYSKASLSVAQENYAVRMYQNVGFEIKAQKEEEYIMVCDLQSAASDCTAKA